MGSCQLCVVVSGSVWRWRRQITECSCCFDKRTSVGKHITTPNPQTYCVSHVRITTLFFIMEHDTSYPGLPGCIKVWILVKIDKKLVHVHGYFFVCVLFCIKLKFTFPKTNLTYNSGSVLLEFLNNKFLDLWGLVQPPRVKYIPKINPIKVNSFFVWSSSGASFVEN